LTATAVEVEMGDVVDVDVDVDVEVDTFPSSFFCPLASFWKYFCAWVRTCTTLRVPIITAIFFHCFPCSFNPFRKTWCSSVDQRPVFSFIFGPVVAELLGSLSPEGGGEVGGEGGAMVGGNTWGEGSGLMFTTEADGEVDVTSEPALLWPPDTTEEDSSWDGELDWTSRGTMGSWSTELMVTGEVDMILCFHDSREELAEIELNW
jgi:hypothetical protein